MSSFRFEIQKIVFVDSVGFCYAEIPVNDHALLLAGGNVGKSSMLNALRLFLLPEVNFRNSQKKFAFKRSDGKGYYSAEDCYRHHFPSSHSFLIMEARNYTGAHCQILYRTQNLAFNRIFVPLPFDQIRHLFWDGNGDEDGIGQAVDDLTAARLIDKLKEMAKGTQIVSDVGKIKRMLYAGDMMSQEEMRYSIMPLSEASDARIESLRTLVLLLFDMASSSSAVALAVASIIEADKKHSTDALDFDIGQFFDRHDELKQQKIALTRIAQEEPAFRKLVNNFNRYKETWAADGQYAMFRQALQLAVEELKQQKQKSGVVLGNSENQLKAFKAKAQEFERERQSKAGELKQLTKQLASAAEIRQKGKLLLSSYGATPQAEVVAIIEEALAEDRERLEALTNRETARTRAEYLRQQVAAQESEIAQLERRIKDREWQLAHQLSESVVGPLAAINPQLITASPGAKLSESDRSAIESFTALFERTDRGYQWFDRLFGSPSTTDAEDLDAALAAARNKHFDYLDQLKELSGQQDQDPLRPKKIEQIRQQIKNASHELETLKRYPGVDQNIQDWEAQSAEITVAINDLEKMLRELSEKQALVERDVATKKSDFDRISQELDKLLLLQKANNELMTLYPRLKAATIPDGARVKELPLTAETRNAIQAELMERDRLRGEILAALREFTHKEILTDEKDLAADSPTQEAVTSAVKRLEDVYRELSQREEILEKQIASHNESVASYAELLTKNMEHIQRFENALNNELEGVTINNLVEIRVAIHTHPKFKSLVEEIRKVDLYSTDLLSDAFYSRLKVFVAEFFENQQDTRLTMDRIIKGLSYKTRKNTEGVLDEKGQSTSSSELINIELVQMLLRRILLPGVEFSLPLVVDEILRVDVGQLDWLLPRAKSKGFNIFAASTYSASAEVIHKIGRYLEIATMKTHKPYNAQRSLVFWGGADHFVGAGGHSGSPLDPAQPGLLEAFDE